jgi:type II secretory pathway pseudopilin PulG
MRRPGLLTLLAILDIIGGVVCVLLGILFVGTGLAGGREGAIVVGMGFAYLLLGPVSLAAGVGLLQMKEWARITRIVLGCLGLLGFPCGTLISALVLLYLLKPGIKVLCSGRSAEDLTAQDVSDVAALRGGSTVVVVLVLFLVFLVAVAVVGIVAAIAIPSLLRARIAANEADAIGDIRTVISSEVSYQQANGGRYGTLDCLAAPGPCIPGYSGSAFIDPAMAKSVKQGYQRTLTLSPDGQRYIFLAVPVTPGGTGTRVFCGGETGLICQAPAASASSSPEQVCDPSRCHPL